MAQGRLRKCLGTLFCSAQNVREYKYGRAAHVMKRLGNRRKRHLVSKQSHLGTEALVFDFRKLKITSVKKVVGANQFATGPFQPF